MRTLFWSRGENFEYLLASVRVVDGIHNTSSSRCKGISSICKGCGLPVSSGRHYHNYNNDDYEYDDSEHEYDDDEFDYEYDEYEDSGDDDDDDYDADDYDDDFDYEDSEYDDDDKIDNLLWAQKQLFVTTQ
jgi:hypothetical protein